MKKILITLIMMILGLSHGLSENLLNEGFEYANNDGETPVGWICANETWLCGYLEKDHNRVAHTGDWYAYTNSAESWMFMPISFYNSMKYHISLWAISDGGYQLELWAGNAAYPSAMVEPLLSTVVNSGDYEQFSVFIEEMASDYQYFGIHAVSAYGDYILTIDDIIVNWVSMYDFHVNPYSIQTMMSPGEQITFRCNMINDGYETLNMFMTPNTDHFTDVHFFVSGEQTNTFPIEPFSTVEIICEATLLPTVEPGGLCWMDVMFTIDCGCASSMFTLWADVSNDDIEDHHLCSGIYPNPSSGEVTIEGGGAVTIYNSLGQIVLQRQIIEKETITLTRGIYFVKKDTGKTEKLIVK